MISQRWQRGVAMAAAMLAATWGEVGRAQEPVLTRPGQMWLAEVTGDVEVAAGGKARKAKTDEAVKAESVVTTGRRALATLLLSNGTTLKLAPESELEIEEYLQAPYSGGGKAADLKEEPSVSRTRVTLRRGEVRVTVKPLKAARGSAFALALPAGTVRTTQGAFYAMARIHDLGLGVCNVELESGAAEMELAGKAEGTPATKLAPGQRTAWAIEVDKATGAVTVGDMPKADAGKK